MITTSIHPDALAALVYADHGAPFDILGAHNVDDKQVSVRAFRPNAETLYVVNRATGVETAMERQRDEGFFEITLAGQAEDFAYHFKEVTYGGDTLTLEDPYRFPPLLTDYDLYLFGEGKWLRSYEKFGAHPREVDGVSGVNFVVWAPNAKRVSVVGDFNGWDARVHPMRLHQTNGVWELFIPGLEPGTIYKYSLRSHNLGYQAEKADPFAFYSELRPRTGSIVHDIMGYEWNDSDWMAARRERDLLDQPMAVYEVHLGSWRRHEDDSMLSYRELAHELIDYVRQMGYTHIELMPVAEHPLDASWGYQVTGYYAPTSRFGLPEDFMYFVDYAHQNGIGVLMDWVPAHFPKDGFALSFFDGTHLYSHEDSRLGEHPDWGTYIFNYGRNEVRNFLISNALYWLDKYHIDGLRVDAVSSMLYLDFGREGGESVANQYGSNENLEAIAFMREFNEVVHVEYPGALTIAEESTAWAMVSRPTYVGGLGFTLKWNMGWMHDTLKYMQKDPIHRRYHHHQLTFSLIYAFNENFVLSLSHDEVVHLKGSLIEKMSGDWWQKFANLRLLFGYQYTHPGKKLNFMGQDFAQWREWQEWRQLDWFLLEWTTHAKLQRWVQDLNQFYQEQPCLYEQDFVPEGFEWIEANDADNSIFAYMRYAKNRDDFVVVVGSFTPVVREDYRLGVPRPGFYRELLNSDAEIYGGGDVGNGGGVEAEEIEALGRPYSLKLTLPPLGLLVFKLEG